MKKIIIFIILIFGCIYLTFPLWSGWLIRTYLPPNLTLQLFDSDYPGLKKITIRHLQFKFNEQEYFIENLLLDYELSNVVIDKVVLVEDPKEDSPIATMFRFPVFKIEDIPIVKKFKLIKIKQLEYNNNKHKYSATDFMFNRVKDSQFEINLLVPKLETQSTDSMKINASMQVDSNQIKTVLRAEDNYLLDVSYQINDQQLEINSKISIENVLHLLTKEYYDFSIRPTGIISLAWRQDLLSNLVDVAIAASVESQSEIEFHTLHGNIKTDPLSLNLTSEIRFEQLDNTIESISINNNKFNLSASNLLITNEELALDLNIKNYSFNGEIENIRTNFDNLKNVPWKMSGLFSSTNLLASMQRKMPDSTLIKNDTIKILSEANIQFNLTKNENYISSGEMLLTKLKASNFNSLFNGNLLLKWHDIESSFSQGKVSITLNSKGGHLADFNFEQLKLASDLEVMKNKIKGAGELFINQHLLTPYSIVIKKEPLRFDLELKENKIVAGITNHYLSQFGKKKKIPLKIIHGDINHSGKISSAKQLLVSSELVVKDLLFQFGENTVQGLNIKQKITAIEPLRLDSLMSIKKIAFSSGLEIKNLNASMNISSIDSIEINTLDGEILGGKLLADKIKFGAVGLKNLSLQLQQLSLTELVFFMDIPGLYAEGKMDFLLPITMDDGAFTISEGTFAAKGKGLIKYSTGQAVTKAEENIALKALENFHYKSLDGTISYNKLGQYHIKIHLLGANPELYNGYPVDFILNLRGELSGVFRSLFLTGNFEQAVMEQVKSSRLEQ